MRNGRGVGGALGGGVADAGGDGDTVGPGDATEVGEGDSVIEGVKLGAWPVSEQPTTAKTTVARSNVVRVVTLFPRASSVL